MRTVSAPGGSILPVGLGIGATQAGCVVISLTRAAGMPPIITDIEVMVIIPGPPGTQGIIMQGAVVSMRRAAGEPPRRTVGCPVIIASGMGGWGTGTGTGAGGCIGAWQCGAICNTMSPILAAGNPIVFISSN
jgi:hypothetical protein